MSDAERELKTLLDRREGERPWRMRDELAKTMHENFGVFRRENQMKEQQRIVEYLRERYERVVVDDKGEVFNNDLTQALELGFLLELAACMVVAGIERKESRGAHARPYDFPDRDDENYMKHTIVRWVGDHPVLDWKPVTMTKWTAAGEEVLMRRLQPSLLAAAALLARRLRHGSRARSEGSGDALNDASTSRVEWTRRRRQGCPTGLR